MILYAIPIKDVLVMGSIVLIDISELKSHRLCGNVGPTNGVASSSHHFLVVGGVTPLNRNVEDCIQLERHSQLRIEELTS